MKEREMRSMLMMMMREKIQNFTKYFILNDHLLNKT